MNYIAYYRTSTKEQNLGIIAQQTAVQRFLKTDDIIIAEYTEQESGKKDNRVKLTEAIEHCRRTDSTLLIAKLDRLSRNLTFISQLMDSKLRFVCCDMPDATNLTIHIFAALAQQERELISQRTKAALAELKAQGVKLGKPENLTDSARVKAVEAIKQNSREANKQVIDFIISHREKLDDEGKGMTFDAIAIKLNSLGYRTRYEKTFSKGNVKQIHDRYTQLVESI